MIKTHSPFTGDPYRSLAEMDAAVRSLTPDIPAQASPDLVSTGLTAPETAIEKASRMATRAGKVGLSHFEDEAEPEAAKGLEERSLELPDSVQSAKDAKPDGRGLPNSVQNDLGGGLWTGAIEGNRHLPVYIEGDITERRGRRARRAGVWMELGNKTIFVEYGDERTHSQRVVQATDELRTGGGYFKKKIGPREDQVRP